MTQINQFQVRNLGTNKGIKFHFAKATDDSLTFNNVTLPAAGLEATSNFGVNFGFKRLTSFDFVLYNDGTDKSLTGDNIITLTEQWRYLIETVCQGSVTNQQYKTKFRLTVYSDGSTWNITGNIEDVNARTDLTNNSNQVEGRITIYQSAEIA